MERSTLYKVLLTVAVLIGGGGFLIYSSVGHAQHYRMVDELIGDIKGDPAAWQGKELKVHGFVESGTIVESVVGQTTHRTFVLQKGGKKIRVFNLGPKPDTFKDQSEVVATGHLVKASTMAQLATDMCAHQPAPVGCPLRSDSENEWVLDSSDLMAKCPSKYDGAPSNKIDTEFH